MERLRAFFKYFGGKHRAAPKYPYPRHSTIVEPFAGSAAYSLLHAEEAGLPRSVILYDKDPAIAGLWQWLIGATAKEIRALPLLEPGQKVSDLEWSCPEAKTLVGFWMRTGSATPRDVPSPWAKNLEYADRFWGEHIRERLARQVERIRGWKASCRSYVEIEDRGDACWFLDPPYQHKGGGYVFGSSGIDYAHLAEWAKERRGQVIVCEQEGADWLPFEFLAEVRSNVNRKNEEVRKSREVIWHREGSR